MELQDRDPHDKYRRFKFGHHVGISNCKNIFAKGYSPYWSEEVFVIKKVKNTVPLTYVINDLNGNEHFLKKNYKILTNKNLA